MTENLSDVTTKRRQIIKDEKILFLLDFDPENNISWELESITQYQEQQQSSYNTRYCALKESLEMLIKRKSNFSEHKYGIAIYKGSINL